MKKPFSSLDLAMVVIRAGLPVGSGKALLSRGRGHFLLRTRKADCRQTLRTFRPQARHAVADARHIENLKLGDKVSPDLVVGETKAG